MSRYIAEDAKLPIPPHEPAKNDKGAKPLTRDQKLELQRGRSLQWWWEHKDIYPNVVQLALKVLSAQGTQCDVERNFSHAGIILNYLRSSMSPDLLHVILFLYENRHLWSVDDAEFVLGSDED